MPRSRKDGDGAETASNAAGMTTPPPARSTAESTRKRRDRNESSEGANDGDLNTIKLVAKRIEYSITKPLAGAGGMKRTIKGIKRFV